MKVLAVLVLVLAAASARSGPYLPSGWRPKGPAFLLPSEIQKLPPNSAKTEENFQESEASGSDTLREYGPPTLDVSQDITSQALPDLYTEQPFDFNDKIETVAQIKEVDLQATSENSYTETEKKEVTERIVQVIETEQEEYKVDDRENVEAVTSARLEEEGEQATTTISVVTENRDESVDAKYVNKEVFADVTTPSTIDYVTVKAELKEFVNVNEKEEINDYQQENDNANSDISSAVEVVAERENIEIKDAKEAVKNIEEVIVNLEKEVNGEQIDGEKPTDTTEVRTGFLEQAPEGFLEYGPPGFQEYGPPKEDLLRINDALDVTSGLENNETRRRRFSSKFRSASM